MNLPNDEVLVNCELVLENGQTRMHNTELFCQMTNVEIDVQIVLLNGQKQLQKGVLVRQRNRLSLRLHLFCICFTC